MKKLHLVLITIAVALTSNFALAITYTPDLAESIGRVEAEKGSASYKLPIEFPEGAGKFKPNLTIAYQSGQGSASVLSPMAHGWDISGLSAITRCQSRLATDGNRDKVDFDALDRFCLFGNPMMLISGNYGEINSKYRFESEQFNIIEVTDAVDSFPKTFSITHKDGTKSIYGNGEVKSSNSAGAETYHIYSWMLKSRSNRSGQQIDFSYNADYSINSISYLGGEVEFVYENTDHAIKAYMNGSSYSSNAIIKKIKISNADVIGVKEELFREYRFNNDYKSETKRHRLRSVTECVRGDVCYKPYNFDYYENQLTFSSSANETLSNGVDAGKPFAMDIDGMVF